VTPEQNPRDPRSCFFRRTRKFPGRFNIYYANFYEKEGFKRALEDDLTNTRETGSFLYVAAHGTGKRIGGLKAKTGMKLPAMFQGRKKRSKLFQYRRSSHRLVQRGQQYR